MCPEISSAGENYIKLITDYSMISFEVFNCYICLPVIKFPYKIFPHHSRDVPLFYSPYTFWVLKLHCRYKGYITKCCSSERGDNCLVCKGCLIGLFLPVLKVTFSNIPEFFKVILL